jgi:hypothetical protein
MCFHNAMCLYSACLCGRRKAEFEKCGGGQICTCGCEMINNFHKKMTKDGSPSSCSLVAENSRRSVLYRHLWYPRLGPRWSRRSASHQGASHLFLCCSRNLFCLSLPNARRRRRGYPLGQKRHGVHARCPVPRDEAKSARAVGLRNEFK